MKIKILFVAFLCVWVLTSCFSDKGNYDYKKDRGVRGRVSTVNLFIGEEVDLNPVMDYGELEDTTNVSYQWFVKDTVVSTDRILHFKGEKIESLACCLYVIDNETGVVSSQNFKINVVSPYSNLKGWALLCSQNGKSEIAHITPVNVETEGGEIITEYRVFKNIYKAQNNNEELGSNPVKLVQHWASLSSELLVIQHGGQGSVELNGAHLTKELTIKQEFVNEVLPANFAPRDIVYLDYVHFIWNGDGKLYSRLVEAPLEGFHQSAFNNIPIYVEKGMRVDDIIFSAYPTTDFVLLYDGLNKRLIPYGTRTASNSGNLGELIFKGTYPPGFTPFDNFGDMKLIYGSSYNDASSTLRGNSADFSMILKNPANGKYYWQTFNILFKKPTFTATIPSDKAVIEFPGGNLISPKSKFWLLKTRSYLFFTAGENNDKLYYYDIKKNSVHLYKDFAGLEISAMHPNRGFTEMGVGLKNGTFTLFDITDATFISGQPRVIFLAEGMDEIVDVIFRYERSTHHWR